MHVIEALCLLNQFSGRGCALIGSIGGERLGIVGDEIVMYPARLVAFNAELGETRLGFLHEGFGFGDGWRVLGSNDGGAREKERGEQEQFHVISDIALVTEGSKTFATEGTELHREAAGRTRDYARVKWKVSNHRGNSVDHHCRIPEMLRGLLFITLLLDRATLVAQQATQSQAAPPSPQSTQSDAQPPSLFKPTTPAAESSQAAPPQLPDSKFLEPFKIVKASYPIEAEANQLQGEVVVKFSVSETGDVEQVEIVSGDPVLAKAAVDAARKWKFKPFIKDGRPVKASTKIPFDFAFKDKVTDVKLKPENRLANGSSGSNRVRVSQGVIQGMVIHKVAPVYPPEAKRARVQGTVILAAIIGKDGRIKNLQVVSGPSALADAAVGAVQQWRYRPYILLGEPVEVDTQITVNFNLR